MGNSKYPSTPSRIQISIWPAGINSSAPGTITWAGGLIDWSDPDYTTNGYFWNTVQSVSVACATDAEVGTGSTGYDYAESANASIPVGQQYSARGEGESRRSFSGGARTAGPHG